MRAARVPVLLAALSLPVAAARAAPAPAGDGFWAAWGDGRGELDGYALVEPRYGEPRDGTAVLIFVTEDFSDSARVKADPGRHPPSDVFPVLKLNFVRKFQTGIYDYSVLTSTFARTEGAPPFAVVKTSFSSQEWCGHVYQQWLARGDRLVGESHSYFDGEADQTASLPRPAGGVEEDALPILVRGLRGDWLAPGERRTVPLLPSAIRARFEHRAQAWSTADVSRSPGAVPPPSGLGVAAGPAYAVTVAERGGPTVTYVVEAAAPRRLLGWSSSTGERGTLLGSTRLAYWELHGAGGEASLAALGLAPLVPPRRTIPRAAAGAVPDPVPIIPPPAPHRRPLRR